MWFLVLACDNYCCVRHVHGCSVMSLCNPMDGSLPSSSVHGTSQARILEWFVISSSRGSSQCRDWTCVSCITGRCFITKPPGIVKWYFCISIFPSTFINWKSSIRKSYPFFLISSFNQLFIFITINSWIWAFSIGYNSSLSSFIFLPKLSQSWPLGCFWVKHILKSKHVLTFLWHLKRTKWTS